MIVIAIVAVGVVVVVVNPDQGPEGRPGLRDTTYPPPCMIPRDLVGTE